jgi:hypothetical protein
MRTVPWSQLCGPLGNQDTLSVFRPIEQPVGAASRITSSTMHRRKQKSEHIPTQWRRHQISSGDANRVPCMIAYIVEKDTTVPE